MKNRCCKKSVVNEVVDEASGFWNDFHNFVRRKIGLDFILGLTLGSAFSDLIRSFADDIFSPPIEAVIGVRLRNRFTVLRGRRYDYETLAESVRDGAVVLSYGQFLMAIIYFLVTAVIVYLLTKLVYSLFRKSQIRTNQMEVRCSYCLECIPVLARKCKYCGSFVGSGGETRDPFSGKILASSSV